MLTQSQRRRVMSSLLAAGLILGDVWFRRMESTALMPLVTSANGVKTELPWGVSRNVLLSDRLKKN